MSKHVSDDLKLRVDAFDWIEVINVADIDDICAIGSRFF